MSKLSLWQERHDRAKSEFEDIKRQMIKNHRQYNGTLQPERGAEVTCIYNFTKELIESAIDPSLPYPKVDPVVKTEENVLLARKIEAMIVGEIKRLNLEPFNDLDERITKSMGGDVALIEWNTRIKTHSTVGDIDIRQIKPTRFIPQDGVFDVERMDYYFLEFEDTKENIRKIYGIDVDDETTDPEDVESRSDDIVTQKWAIFRNSEGSIGAFSWVGDKVLVDNEKFQQRSEKVCTNCGLPKPVGENKCSCGNHRWKTHSLDFEELTEDILDEEGNILVPAMQTARDELGNLKYREEEIPVEEMNPLTCQMEQQYEQIFDEKMNPIGDRPMTEIVETAYEEPTRIPYYVPKNYPIAIRKNVSQQDAVFGESDAEMIFEMQDKANKIATRLIQKAFNGGRILTKMKKSDFNFDNDLQVIEIEAMDELAAIKSVDLTFDTSSEISLINQLYFWAKSLLGINDSSQGKQDTTATSGRAKEAQISRAQARQASKVTMKNNFYQQIYRLIFEFALAYMDEPRNYPSKTEAGEEEDIIFNRYEFLKQDQFGNWYYNDQFIITTDAAGSSAENRQYNLELMLADYNAGLYGDPKDPETILTFWKDRESMNYPNAKRQVARWQEKVDELKEEQELMQDLMQPPGAVPEQEGVGDEMQMQM